MTSCILTVIKNEQEYLDEWIKYHLNLGIDHIFIFEDYDSESHQEICNKYDKVTLDNIFSILSEEDQKLAKEVKELKKYSVQHLYFRNGLIYLQKLYSDIYDWCFLIDNDEFLTFKNKNDKLDNILNLYKDYDAYVISWKWYGANGLINKPDYSTKGIVDTYINEAIGKRPNTVKSCYKLKTFRNEFLYTHHHPTDICNWCNTNYVKDYKNAEFSKIYIRHYITKSWEEFIWKRKIRGYVWGRERDFDYFFKINPDMIDKKEELMNQINEEILIVLPYKQSKSQGNEIKLALNGWKKFCKFKYRFVVIGEFNEELKNEFPWVKFVNCPSLEKKEGQYNPHLDIMNKFKIISKLYGQEYNGFIYTTDDQYPIKQFDLDDVMRIYYHSKDFVGVKNLPTFYWKHDKWKTRQLLDKENLPHINYTTHHPCFFEFIKLMIIRKKYKMLEESYVFDDVYFNYFKHEEPILDSNIRLGIWNQKIFKEEFRNAINNPNIKFICNSVEGWSKELEKELEKIVN